ncbi:hypothetical protein ACIKT0_15740, partial [Hansschlegelia beijingensis]|uniref:hypothetical protein n=1 Tax=Hansschlegelia beijingensis TaxID=1133344 RepID=UPI00387F299F
MSDTRARTGVEVQLGARARSILKTLSNAAPGGLRAHPAARRLLGAPSLAAREPFSPRPVLIFFSRPIAA